MFVFLCCFAAFGMTVSRPIHVATSCHILRLSSIPPICIHPTSSLSIPLSVDIYLGGFHVLDIAPCPCFCSAAWLPDRLMLLPRSPLSAASVALSGTPVLRSWAPSPCSPTPLPDGLDLASSRGSMSDHARAEDEPMNSAGNSEPQTRGQQPPPQRGFPQKPSCVLFTFTQRREGTGTSGHLPLGVPPPATECPSHTLASRATQAAELTSFRCSTLQMRAQWPTPEEIRLPGVTPGPSW